MSEKEITLGEFLRNEREHRGITIEQVASATKVGVRTLHALEGDHYSELPARPYIRGFVTSYCRFIGLDPKEIRARFEDYISAKASERPNREGGHSGYAFEKKDGEQQSRTILLIAICSFIVVGGVAVLFLKPSLRHHRSSHIDKLRAAHGNIQLVDGVLPFSGPSASPSPSFLAVSTGASPIPVVKPEGKIEPQVEEKVASIPENKEEAETKETSQVKVQATASPSPQIGLNPKDPLDSGMDIPTEELHHKMTFKVVADIWVRFKVDDRPVRRFVVRKGKVLVLKAKDKAIIQISNPNSALFSYNGNPSLLVAKSKPYFVHGAATLSFGWSEAENSSNVFAGEKSLPKTPDPEIDTNSQNSTP